MDGMKFNVGEKVIITGKSRNEAYLDKYVGVTGIIKEINSSGADVKFDNGHIWYFSWGIIDSAEKNEWTA